MLQTYPGLGMASQHRVGGTGRQQASFLFQPMCWDSRWTLVGTRG
jgi:hypothetical protein